MSRPCVGHDFSRAERTSHSDLGFSPCGQRRLATIPLQHLARVRLHHHPDRSAHLQMQRFSRRRRQVYFKLRTAIHLGNHHHIALLQRRDHATRKHCAHSTPVAQTTPAECRRREFRYAAAAPDPRATVELPAQASNPRPGRSSFLARDGRPQSRSRRCFRSLPTAPPSPIAGATTPHAASRAPRSARIERNDIFAQRKNLFALMSDVQNRNPMLVVPGAQVVQNLRFGHRIERGQRLIQQQHARIRDQRARQRRPLPLASRNLVRTPPSQLKDSKQMQDFSAARLALRFAKSLQAVLHVLRNRHVRKQRQRLQQISNGATVGRKVQPAGRTEQHALADGDPTRSRVLQSGNAVENRRLPSPGRAKQNREARGRSEVDLQRERRATLAGKTLPDANAELTRSGCRRIRSFPSPHIPRRALAQSIERGQDGET